MRIGWQIPWDKSYVLALDVNTGKERYRARRGQTRIAHVTPNIVTVDGKPQLISPAGDAIEAFDPDTGNRLWWVTHLGEGVVPSPVFGDGVIYASTGFPTALPDKNVYPAIRAFRLGGGTGDLTQSNLLWEQRKGATMIPSLLLAQGLLYSLTENGALEALDPRTGEIVYADKLKGQFSASPLSADGKIYCSSNEGITYVLAPGREFKLLATNDLGEKTQASLAASAGRLFLRTEKALYCIKP
jgi:outer membrane protein assembly factor BamB